MQRLPNHMRAVLSTRNPSDNWVKYMITNPAIQQIHTAFNHVAPNGKVQQALVTAVHEMERESAADNEIILMIACAIVDGLRYGNWPGIKPVD